MNEIEKSKRLFFEALDLIDLGDFQKAELRLRDALRFTPASVSVLTNLATLLLQRNEFSEACEYAEKAVANKRDDVEALSVLTACYNHDEKYVEMLDISDRIIAIEPQNIATHNSRGLALENLNRLEEALKSYERDNA